MNERFVRGVYRDCKWCLGRGCLSCGPEADKEYRRQFPDPLEPLLVIVRKDYDHFAVSAVTGGPSIADAHGQLGELLSEINDLMPHKI